MTSRIWIKYVLKISIVHGLTQIKVWISFFFFFFIFQGVDKANPPPSFRPLPFPVSHDAKIHWDMTSHNLLIWWLLPPTCWLRSGCDETDNKSPSAVENLPKNGGGGTESERGQRNVAQPPAPSDWPHVDCIPKTFPEYIPNQTFHHIIKHYQSISTKDIINYLHSPLNMK